MHILLYEWESYLQFDIKWICKEKGVKFTPFSWRFETKNKDETFERWFFEQVDITQFDALFSINYWPLLSKVANKRGLKYIAWCYDNPLNIQNIQETLGNPVNTVVFFDRIQYEHYLTQGFETVHYLPLAVNTKRLERLNISAADRKKYSADVSLVGSLYESKMQELKRIFNDYTNGYLDATMSVQQELYGCYIFDEVITEDFIKKINNDIHKRHPESSFRIIKEALTFAMASEVTRKERLTLLTLFGRRYNTRLYSFQRSEILKEVDCLPPIDYVEEMPKVFACTKININPMLRCIQSGIPLRALDVMGVGGFLLSSYQQELAERFVDGAEMVMYENYEDALEKAKYYLANDDVRCKVAENGKKKIYEQFSMMDRWNQIMDLANLE